MRGKQMSANEKNRFSELLEQLINISGVKSAGLAKALQYDASYISKWVSGRMLPTEKTKKIFQRSLKTLSMTIWRSSMIMSWIFKTPADH